MSAEGEPPAKRARVRQACQACRDAKLRCDLGDPGEPKDPPCQRCSRSGRQCQFVGSHLHHKPRKMNSRKSISRSDDQNQNHAAFAESTAAEPSQSLGQRSKAPPPPLSLSKSPEVYDHRTSLSDPLMARSPYRGNINFGATIETPADALRVLVAAADEEFVGAAAPVADCRDPKIWNQWEPVRDGLLTTEEARTLLAFYAEHLGPLHPVVPEKLFETDSFDELLDEPILLAAICLAAARFCAMGPSYMSSEPFRSRVIQQRLVDWLLTRLGYITMGDPTFRTIGTVEALLVLSEFPPRALLLKDPSRARESTLSSACKLFDDLAWTLTGLALRIAQELSLQDEKSYTKESPAAIDLTRRRMNAWMNCLAADRHVSVRLGRVSLVQAKMSTNWWEVWGSCYVIDDKNWTTLSDPKWHETQVLTELTHNLGLVQELLYATPDLTNDLIRTRQFEPLLHRLKPELDSICKWLIPSTVVTNPLEESVSGNELQELRAIRIRFEIDYIRLYANAISMRAAHHRLAPRLRETPATYQGSYLRVFESSVLRWSEAPFLLESVEAAISLMRTGIALHRRGVLRYCPGRTFLRMMFAGVFLMKAMSFGAVVQSESDMVNLQYDLIDSLKEAAVDDDHIAVQIASLLSRIFPARPKSRSSDDGVDQDAEPDPLSLLNFDFGNVDGSVFGDIGVDAGNTVGYDPNGLVSFIEAMLEGSGVDGGEMGTSAT